MTRIPYLIMLVAAVACSGFASLTASALLLPQTGAPPANPFITYADILPGQPKSAVVARGFICSSSSEVSFGTGRDEHCVLESDREFAQIQLNLSRGVVVSTQFLTAHESIRLGDLMAWLGKATLIEQCAMSGFSWRGQSVLIWSSSSDLSPFSPLWKVTVTRTC